METMRVIKLASSRSTWRWSSVNLYGDGDDNSEYEDIDEKNMPLIM